ncbi:ABC transporter ATP-binding protein [Alteribacillus sp. HJP-4]|uniref:ABC transporter ATP-binding protein n=1 Tax=Alteribacillus sp. HJP-4 TaxID=2775394 RepID=UPI0035CD239A
MRIEKVTKQINKKNVLKNVSFTLRRGSITGVIGRNGAGKTTLLKIMTDIYRPTEGAVEINARNISIHPDAKQEIVYVPDSAEAIKSYSTSEAMKLYADIYPGFDKDYYDELMNRFRLESVKKVKNYSKGKRALFSLILAFSARASYVLLDEPTDGLDVIVKKDILKMILEEAAEHETAIIIASHRLDELEKIADHLLILDNGSVTTEIVLDDLKSQYKKVQVAFSEQLPEDLELYVHILEQTGRVYVLLLEKNIKEMEQRLLAAKPLLYDTLPLSLEDIFIARLGGKENVS